MKTTIPATSACVFISRDGIIISLHGHKYTILDFSPIIAVVDGFRFVLTQWPEQRTMYGGKREKEEEQQVHCIDTPKQEF
jgi:hypothetical protein